jgi:hypothetical protein
VTYYENWIFVEKRKFMFEYQDLLPWFYFNLQ